MATRVRFYAICSALWMLVVFVSNSDLLAQETDPKELSENHPAMQARRYIELEQQRQLEGLLKDSLRKTELKLSLAQGMVDEYEGRLSQLQDVLERHDVSEHSFADVVTRLQLQRVTLSIDKAGVDARVKSLMETVEDENMRRAVTTVKKRQKLEELLALETEALAMAEEAVKKGTRPTTALRDRRTRMIEVELQLLELDAGQSGAAGDNRPASLTTDLALERIELAARLDKVNELLRPLHGLRATVAEIDTLRASLKHYREQLIGLESERTRVMLELQEAQKDAAPKQAGDQN